MTPIEVAVHEAGHCTVGFAVGVTIEKVHIRGGDKYLGLTHYQQSTDPRAHAAFLCGGFAATDLLEVGYRAPSERTRFNTAAAASPCAPSSILDDFEQLAPLGMRMHIVGLRAASIITSNHWSAVYEIADRLLQHQFLHGSAVTRICQRCEVTPYSWPEQVTTLAAHRHALPMRAIGAVDEWNGRPVVRLAVSELSRDIQQALMPYLRTWPARIDPELLPPPTRALLHPVLGDVARPLLALIVENQ